jgi:large subunit ribosomal protein L15
VGRGLGSGHGTYATRGSKGQTQRSGHRKMPAQFEGGRQPLVRQLPKLRGFRGIHQKAHVLALDQLNVFDDGDIVTPATLSAKGLVVLAKNARVKLLAGKLSRKLIVKVPVSQAAKIAIERAGGTVKQ